MLVRVWYKLISYYVYVNILLYSLVSIERHAYVFFNINGKNTCVIILTTH